MRIHVYFSKRDEPVIRRLNSMLNRKDFSFSEWVVAAAKVELDKDESAPLHPATADEIEGRKP